MEIIPGEFRLGQPPTQYDGQRSPQVEDGVMIEPMWFFLYGFAWQLHFNCLGHSCTPAVLGSKVLKGRAQVPLRLHDLRNRPGIKRTWAWARKVNNESFPKPLHLTC